MTAVSTRRHFVRADRASHPRARMTPGSPPFRGVLAGTAYISRWQAELAQVTELSLACQQAADAADAGTGFVAGRLERWAGLAERRGACHHPDGSVRFLRSALAIFGTELTAHARGQCTATSSRPFLPVPAGIPASQADWT